MIQVIHTSNQCAKDAPVKGLMPDNQVTLLENGEAYFPALEAAVDRAVYEIYLETYIFEDDATGRRIADALRRAALRGVKTHVLLDGFGSKHLPQSLIAVMQTAGAQVFMYRPKISPWTFRRKRLRRLHRKIAVIDRNLAFVGGINIIDDMNTVGRTPPRYDYAVTVEGPLVAVIHRTVRRMWSLAAWTNFRIGWIKDDALPVSHSPRGQMRSAFLVRDNVRHRRDIEEAYLCAIEQAQSEIIVANAYFLPGFQFRHALNDAAGRGVRVILLVQERVEYRLMQYATQALYGNLLDAGVDVYEYHKSFMHAKVAVVDEHWATVGSSNLDPFSLLLSREANVVVDDAAFARTLKHSLNQAIKTGARQICKANWKQRPARLRFLNWLSYGVVRFIIGISGYAHENSAQR